MKKLILFSVFLLLISATQTVFACSCPDWEKKYEIVTGKLPFDGKEYLKSYEKSGGAIFIGKVLKIKKVKFPAKDYNWYDREVTLSVSKSWVGANSQKVVVYTNKSDAACGFPFQKNASYIIFADKELQVSPAKTQEDKLSVGWCSYTTSVYRAENILNGLGEAKISF